MIAGGIDLSFWNVSNSYIEGFLETLPERLKGSYKEWPHYRGYRKPPTYTNDQYWKLDMETMNLHLTSDEDLGIIKNWLQLYQRVPTKESCDQLVLYRAFLNQIKHPKEYTARMCRSHVAMFILQNVDFFEHHLKYLLNKTDQTFENYIRNIINGTIWGDYIILGALGKMFNVKVTVLSPCYSKTMANISSRWSSSCGLDFQWW